MQARHRARATSRTPQPAAAFQTSRRSANAGVQGAIKRDAWPIKHGAKASFLHLRSPTRVAEGRRLGFPGPTPRLPTMPPQARLCHPVLSHLFPQRTWAPPTCTPHPSHLPQPPIRARSVPRPIPATPTPANRPLSPTPPTPASRPMPPPLPQPPTDPFPPPRPTCRTTSSMTLCTSRGKSTSHPYRSPYDEAAAVPSEVDGPAPPAPPPCCWSPPVRMSAVSTLMDVSPDSMACKVGMVQGQMQW